MLHVIIQRATEIIYVIIEILKIIDFEGIGPFGLFIFVNFLIDFVTLEMSID